MGGRLQVGRGKEPSPTEIQGTTLRETEDPTESRLSPLSPLRVPGAGLSGRKLPTPTEPHFLRTPGVKDKG